MTGDMLAVVWALLHSPLVLAVVLLLVGAGIVQLGARRG